MTLLLFLFMGAFLVILLYRCLTNETVKVESYHERVNRVKDVGRVLTLNKDNFEVSLYVGYAGRDVAIKDEIDTYFDYSISTIDY